MLWLFLCLQRCNIWFSVVRILLRRRWSDFEKVVFNCFVGSDPPTEGMECFCSALFVNILCRTQKNGRIWSPVVGSSPSGRLCSLLNSPKSVFSVVRSLRLEEKSKMDRYKFEKRQARKKRRNLSKSPLFSFFLGRIDFDQASWQGQEDSNPRPTVLEWMRKNRVPPECSFFRRVTGN